MHMGFLTPGILCSSGGSRQYCHTQINKVSNYSLEKRRPNFHLEPIGQKSVVEKSVSDDELDHDNDEIKKFTENKTTKIDIISVTNINSQQFSI